MLEKVPAKLDGCWVYMTQQEAVLRRLFDQALHGDHRSMPLLIKLMSTDAELAQLAAIEARTAERADTRLTADERRLLADHLKAIQGRTERPND